METILQIIGIACLGICFTQFTPLQRLVDRINIEWMTTLLTCNFCCSFWFGISLTGNIYYAGTAAVLSSIISNRLM